jgi:hypothetical protein
MNEIELTFQWRTTLAEKGGNAYTYPDKFTRYFRESYSKPAIYRWRVLKRRPGGRETIYIGEAEELRRRIQLVRTPPKKVKETQTNKKLHQTFKRLLQKGRKIVIDIADVGEFRVNGVRFGADSIEHAFQRKAIENILLALAHRSGEFKLLNVWVDPAEQVRKELQRLSPSQLRRLKEVMKVKGY